MACWCSSREEVSILAASLFVRTTGFVFVDFTLTRNASINLLFALHNDCRSSFFRPFISRYQEGKECQFL